MTILVRSFGLLSLLSVAGVSYAAQATDELQWSSVQLNGMHLRLVSPKPRHYSEDLYFKNGNLAVSACSKDSCTGPLTIWKIENNRLKTGFVPDEGDALIGVKPNRLILRKPDGRVFVYAIIPNSRT